MKDLLRAMVLATMFQPYGSQSPVSAIKKFENAYKGKSKIFD
jgi:hypothetical protein